MTTVTTEPNLLLEQCEAILRQNGIEPFGPRALRWTISGELDEAWLARADVERRIFGYPVVVEWLVGEHTVILTETIAFASVPFKAVAA